MLRRSRKLAATGITLLWMTAAAGGVAAGATLGDPTALWLEEADLVASDGTGDDRLGFAVAFAGDTAVLGAIGVDVDGHPDQGAVYVFVRSGGVWSEQAKLTATDGAESDSFGWSVAVSGDTVLVGAPKATVDGDFSRGAAYVFTRSGETWSEQAKLVAADGAPSDDFGRSVALEGDTAVVGAYFAEVDGNFRQGAAYVFTRNAGVWSEQDKLAASDGVGNARFGSSVALSGDTAVVGAQTADVGGNSIQGAAYVFTLSGGVWSEQAKLVASDGAAFDQLGNAVAVSGDTAVVGAAFAAVDGSFQQGAAYVYTRSGAAWSEQAKLTASDGAASHVFGTSVAVDGDVALVGAPGQNAAFLFTRSNDVWSEHVELLPGGGAPGDFGRAVDVSGPFALAGAPFTGVGAEASQGVAYAFFDLPADFGTVTGAVRSLGYCGDRVIPWEGVTVTITGAQGTYAPVTDGEGSYQVFLPADESPLTITATAPGHQPVTVDGVILAAGETVVQDFDLPLDAPCPTLDPEGISAQLLPDETTTRTLTIGNLGTADLVWQAVEDEPIAQGLRRPLRPATPVPVAAPHEEPGTGEWGRAEGKGRLEVDPQAAGASGGPLTLTHSASLDVAAGNSIACIGGGNTTPAQSFLRTFTLADFGIDDAFGITEVAFGIESLTTAATIEVNLYTLEGDFVFSNLTPIGSRSVLLPAQDLTFVEIPIGATAPAGSTLVVEIRAPDLHGIGGFFPGSNSAGETAHSYIAAPSCGTPEPATYSSIGFPQVHLVMTVSGGTTACGAEWLTVAPASGTVGPDGNQQVDVTLDSTGLTPVPGEHHSRICLDTNDPERPEIFVPVDLSVGIPPGFGTVQGTVEGLGHCAAAAAPIDGATVLVESQARTYTLSPDGSGFYQLGLDPAEGPVDITVSAPGHTPQTVTDVPVVAGQTEVRDFGLVLEQPCATVDPQELAVELPEGETETLELTLGNVDGGATLHWTVDTAEPPVASVAGGTDCDSAPGLIVHDDGTIENAYSGNFAAGVEEVRFVDRFTPAFHPASLGTVCLSFATVEGGPSSLDFEIVVYDDDGPEGGPGSELGALAATVTDIPVFPVTEPAWASFDVSTLGITVATGSVYVGARWAPSNPNVWLAADESPPNPVGFAGGYWWNENDGVWAPTQDEFDDYRSMFVRATVAGTVDCDGPGAVSWLSVDPASGSVPLGGTATVQVSVDSTGLPAGTYEAGVCVATDDPANPLTAVPVVLTVAAGGPEEIKITAGDGAEFDLFGRSVAIDGDTAVVSADNADVGGNGNQGAAYVFVRDGESWVEQAKLTASDGAQFDQFGFSVAVSGDTALIGTAADAAYVFTRDGETWSERAKLTPTDGVPDDNFGIAVALESDTALIGARQADVGGNMNQGAAYMFVGAGESWVEQAKLTAGDGMAFDVFGDAVALDGDTAVVGAAFADPGGSDAQGAAYVFTRDGGTWSEQAKLTASDGVSNDWFGHAVAVSGDTALITASQATVDGNAFQGAAYVFTRGGTTWSEQAKLFADDGAAGDTFGESVAVDGDTALVGALFADSAQGTAYVYSRTGDSWSQEGELSAADGAPGDQFGKSVALDGGTAIVGAWTAGVGGNGSQGAAYVFTLAGGPAVIPVDDGVVEVAADGLCSLIEAFENAEDGGATHADCVPGSPAGNTVVLAEGSLYTLTAAHNGDAGPNGLPTVAGQILVQGGGAIIERSSGAPLFRLLHVAGGGALTVEELTLRGGSLGTPDLSGAGIRNDGTLTVSHSTLTGNGGAGSGGAIYNADGATLTVGHSSLQGNSGGGAGSGLHNAGGGTAVIDHSTVSGNGCGGGGCGIQNDGALTVTNSTISNNGGPFANGIHNLGSLTLDHSTVSGHTCGAGGCSLTNGGSATLRNSLIAAPPSTGDCSGPTPTYEGVNLIQDGSCGCTAPSCLSGDPLLGPLADNGGATETHALVAGSIAIDKGGDGLCLADDQRGVARPLDGPGDGSAGDLDGGCDIGAFEAEPPAAPELSFDPASLDFGDVEVGTTSPPLAATLQNTGGADAHGLFFTFPDNGFSGDLGTCGSSLPAGESCEVSVTFTPSVPGPAASTFEVIGSGGAAASLGLAGNGVAPDAPVLDVDPDSLSSTLPAGGMETQTLTVANPGGSALDWEVVDQIPALERIGAIELAAGEDFVFSSVIDPAGELAYFGTLTSPGRIVKIDLATFERVGVLTLPGGEDFLDSGVIDPAGEFAYFATAVFPGPQKIVKIDLATFERVGAITLAEGENDLRSAVIDPAGQFAYFGTLTNPGQVVKIDLQSFQWVGAITLEEGENSLFSAVMDPAGEFAYFGTETSPGRVIKIDLATFQRADALTLGQGEDQLISAAIDPAGAFAYFGTAAFSAPSRVVKIDLATFQRVGSVSMAEGEEGLFSAAADPAGAFAAFGTGTFPAQVALVDLETFQRIDGITMESGEDTFFTGEIDAAGAFAYFGTFTVPGRVVKVGLAADCALPGWVGVAPESGSLPAGESQAVAVTFDAAGLAPGEYAADLCLSSNDPFNPRATVPLSLTVTGGAPELAFEPASLDFGDVPVGGSSPPQIATLSNTGDADATGLSFGPLSNGFEADTSACGDSLPAGDSCDVSLTFSPTVPGPATATLSVDSAEGAAAELALSGNGVGDQGFTAMALEVDPEPQASDGNHLFEPGERVQVAPAWRNDGSVADALAGTASAFHGPDGATYTLVEDAADYGTLEPGQTASCRDSGACYLLEIDDPAARPATHWEATFDETLSDTAGTTRAWTLHIGDSFADVPRDSLFYPWIETLLHHRVTGGCADATYCPAAANTRGQMAVFLLKASEGGDYLPPACVEGEEVFADVSFDNLFCPWIEELAGRGVTAGCGGGNYCPNASVNRDQMAVFLLKALEGQGYTPPACTGVFGDVPCPSLFANWVEDLVARGITAGCGGGNYCPANPVSRDQMAVFLSKTFGLSLYGP